MFVLHARRQSSVETAMATPWILYLAIRKVFCCIICIQCIHMV
jgi:hypothetical protein